MSVNRNYIDYKIAEYPQVNERDLIEWVVLYERVYL